MSKSTASPGQPLNRLTWLDRLTWIGATASFVCAIHCLAMPLLIGVLPLIGLSLLTEPWIEWSLIGFTGAIGLLTLLPSYYQRHRRFQPLALFALGFGLILSTKWLVDEGSSLETSGMVTGALFVAGANLTNHRFVHTCTTCHH
ncbi:MAG: MerC domain-containing protein [Chloracidobacterium sp.]|uniref:MerC domain-containing protein n=1 Tax=Chloracidobacterium validum TaxID=2821543 RepID=A0ABX8B8Q6_9BACT|nr:MerC domain-containing protein [Chloracidobacterium validum]QUW03273.1 MerC domain-containing protein [Chloracidobacterium validum]